ncbi:hypothetical protein B0H63DRAFT_504501 [Podospora didyma]|uniref:Aminoglycoside phosphotransferase domain-containing protein n=1 Tax=Podospora didyma TaxID=330526 RepID=A0AAE0K071_9PEZI|nr:hypothetical protein B0H63DRAFT_504501 [Podospora didyma]
MAQPPKTPPSARWASFDYWDYNGMKERLESLLQVLDKSALLRHAEELRSQKFTMSEPFSAGHLIIARVRLPRHPDIADKNFSEEHELYSLCPGSRYAVDAGAIYMLLEGFYGNTLQDVEFNILKLLLETQQHIITQWTRVQAELAALAFPQIGSINPVSATTGEPVLGKLSSALADGISENPGPFSTSTEYLTAIAEAAFSSPDDSKLGAAVFIDILQKTDLYRNDAEKARFPLSHMDLGTQNVLVDDDFNFLAVIDWEFAQTGLWQVNYFPMQFPLLMTEGRIKSILQNPDHFAYKNVRPKEDARQMYVQKFRKAEEQLRADGRPLDQSIADMLDDPASRIYAYFNHLEGGEDDIDKIHEMVRLAFSFDEKETKQYVEEIAKTISWEAAA